MMTSAISSAVEASAFLTTSRVIGSTARSGVRHRHRPRCCRDPSSRAVHPGGTTHVESSSSTSKRPGALAAEQSGAIADRRLDRACRRAEVGSARALHCRKSTDRGERIVLPGRRPLDAGERPHRHDVERVVGGAVAVGAHVLGDEVLDDAVDVDGARRDEHGQLVCLAGVAHVGVACDAHRRAARASRQVRSRLVLDFREGGADREGR